MLETTGQLRATRNLTVDEQVAMFIYILAHHQKNRTMKTNFLRSGETISRYFNKVLNAVLRIQDHLLKAPSPVCENSTDEKWKWFKNCIGALDGTYIKVKVSEIDKPRYRNRKGDTAINVLGMARRGKGANHVWTAEEDMKLVESMVELKKSGNWDGESGSGLKKGHKKELERILEEKLPGHGLREKPHIESRCKLLKKQYHAIYDVRTNGELSGFGWDDARKCLTASKDVWDDYLKSHPDSTFMKHESFPYYDQLALVWGKDRANGMYAEAPRDVIEDLER
ncbi:hypothetical protein C2S52_006312 [Perilla frutescens var. hirtella]|nr:hypothetical protein C2S52_006312 [Perilla frutescens var. hirtella]